MCAFVYVCECCRVQRSAAPGKAKSPPPAPEKVIEYVEKIVIKEVAPEKVIEYVEKIVIKEVGILFVFAYTSYLFFNLVFYQILLVCMSAYECGFSRLRVLSAPSLFFSTSLCLSPSHSLTHCLAFSFPPLHCLPISSLLAV